MVRPTQQLHPAREPAPVRAAATVLLLRDSEAGVEVLMTRRSGTASFAPGAYVFPGGQIDAADEAASRIAARRPTQSGLQLTQAIAAIREGFEELGVLLARHADGRPVSAQDIASMDRSTTSPVSFAEQCAARGLVLACDQVFSFAHWITDRDLPKRFDVPFLVARMPEGQTPTADESEQFEPCWVRPADALARHAAGSFFMIFPTVRTLQRLAAYASVDAVLQACAAEQPLWTSCPRAGLLRGQDARYMESDSPYGELALVCPDGQLLHALDWQSERAVPLLRNVQRLTAPNPGAMTGPGTNSYIVGDAATGYLVIDPGPNDAAHIDRLWRATEGNIRMIVCTHSHADHSPGAAPLQALCKAKPQILGLSSAPTARSSARFAAERELRDGERLVVSGSTAEGEPVTHTLRAIHTPGHAANHLCLVLEEDGLLFSGDHILNGSTTVVDPPDGDMNAYLDSLDKLDAACEAGGIDFILPAHGHVIGSARSAIAQLKAHRLKREAKIAAAMQRLPGGTPDDWLPLAYDDVPERMWPVAARSLAAHVARIRQRASTP
ncbi:glyoxylase-like metal-dependent hydrolase (beta-lactamase superfamily II)/8-oxo-dGTP pyrophosphatase MutT (NUDIX family) [Variovorax paradoxus]|uniref:Glyoxylase-like metal-dependent hydrolase (Beta-lactamase superfamily II)/8-oxo-dGTP pyrophosphatase MutT (NUDIX family) n=1 Tax=Variovorax paradoxus TaxID=34073 RepID=A0AAE3XSF5_VARPD|nr:MBL fold metallo-hydrolase [Variovorax paradoxus]MDP9966382.1 glyoxylase-like metal-dependent hydrolase (beta-lactamase superfamily II)/8-oxo-dGTP pyrophosphatase MutT (NUDIX family) [Variovorax paradoxus]MDR6424074.1 glyoxylase-like metal-dependent hydrolase (beta-lactamase superfamily II)/8-oxo-dGTP pyrophosphatase MutT (NUDIX family) [Variovorax paradoxus]